jgi:hypothetical protein
LPLSSPVYIQHPLVGSPLVRGLALFVLAVTSVPHPHPLTVICCFFFSSTGAILLSKLCLSPFCLGGPRSATSLLYVLEPNIPLSRPRLCSSQLHCCCYKNKLFFILNAKHFTSFFVGLTSFSTRVLCCPPTLHFLQPHDWCLMNLKARWERARAPCGVDVRRWSLYFNSIERSLHSDTGSDDRSVN